jgi:pilus assembly protein CpaE
MDKIIASNDQAMANKVRDCLTHVDNLCSSCRVMSREAALSELDSRPKGTPLVLYFVVASFGSEDFALLKQTCLASGDAKVVAISAGSDPNVIVQVMRCGAVDYLDISRAMETDLANLSERLNAANRDAGRAGKLISVLTPTGGAGASFLAANLAVLCAEKDGSCGLLDLHLRGGDLARLLNLTPRFNLASLIGKPNVDVTMFAHSVTPHSSGVKLLASPEPFTDYRQITPDLVQRIVQCARYSFRHVIVDLEDAEHPEQARLLGASHQIVIPLRPDLVSLYRTVKCLEHLTRAKVSPDHITIVVNRVGQPKALSIDCMAEALGVTIHHQIPDDPAGVNAACNLGVPVVLGSPKGQTAQRLTRLAESLRCATTPREADAKAGGWLARCKSWLSGEAEAKPAGPVSQLTAEALA